LKIALSPLFILLALPMLRSSVMIRDLEDSVLQKRLINERLHFNAIVRQRPDDPLVMPWSNIQRYRNPLANTPYPLEYVFYLAGDLQKRAVIEVGSGDGLNTVKLAALGANVTAVDISDESLRLTRQRAKANRVDHKIRFVNADAASIGLRDCSADLVIAVAVLHHVEIAPAAREISRVLKPGGRAIFMEPLMGSGVWQATKPFLPKAPEVSPDERPLSLEETRFVTRTIGTPGPARYFGLSYRLIKRLKFRNRSIVHASHLLDRELLYRMPFLRDLASPLVWSADKGTAGTPLG
jgi:SAM-dependent methyltransferase